MQDKCTVVNCDSTIHAKKMCKLHYQRSWRTGSPFVEKSNAHAPLFTRFWRFVEKKTDDDCWEWTGYRDKEGYGTIKNNGRTLRASRVSWEIHNGPIPRGAVVRHRCNNPPCVNPRHLLLGDHKANMRDRKRANNYASNDRHPNAKFSDEIVLAIRESKEPYKQLAKKYGISISQIGNIRNGRQRKTSEARP